MNVYIYNDVPDLVLQKVLDFHNNTYWDFTYVNTQAGWLTINTSWWYCTQSEAQTTTGAWYIYKTINANRFWWRVKFTNTNHAHGWCWPWAFAGTDAPLAQNFDYYPDSPNGSIISIYDWNNTVVSETASCSLDTYYYMDVKFDNWLYTWILLDSNLSPLKTITYQSSDTKWLYSWFHMWWWWSNRACWRVYEYREAYDNN